MRAWLRRWGRLLAGLVLLGGLVFFSVPLPEELVGPRREVSLRLLDREGRLLREVLSTRAGITRWVSLDEVSPALVDATLISEDRRFYYHPGVDLVAVARAAWNNLWAGEVVSGGSTITQQLVRNLTPPDQRTAGTKAREALYALRLEFQMSKRDVLEAYLNRVPYGRQTFGIEAAARTYFDKPASALSVSEAAFLAVLPRAPGEFDPYSDLEAILPFQGQLLERMLSAGVISSEDHAMALQEPIVLSPPSGVFQAAHFCDYVLDHLPDRWLTAGEIATSLDLELQLAVEALLRSHLSRLEDKGVRNGAVVVLDVEDGDVLAMVGSPDYFDFQSEGQFNATLGHRQPGSTLKPFTYGLLLERGATPASLLPDVDLYLGKGRFIPSNYDWQFHGPVRMRTALACSYNVSAVRALEEVGVDALLRRLQSLGMEHLTESPEHYGLGLTLGDADVSLLELARAYRCLARGGVYGPERCVLKVLDANGEGLPLPEMEPGPRVLSPLAAYQLTHILSDPEARVPAFGRGSSLALPFPCAAKTGTSKGFRDNWTVGYTPRYVVAVWVGNNDGRPMVGVSGITGAGPLFRDVMFTLDRLDSRGTPAGRRVYPDFSRPDGIVEWTACPSSGQRPGPDCPTTMFEIGVEGMISEETCTVHRRLTVDRRTGRLAGPDCPPRFADERLYEVYPPVYREWMRRNGLALPPLESGSAGGELRIAFPDDGAVFAIDPILRPGFQRILLRAVVPEGATNVEWFVDHVPLEGEVAPTGSAWWSMKPGSHVLDCEATVGGQLVRSTSVHVVVR